MRRSRAPVQPGGVTISRRASGWIEDLDVSGRDLQRTIVAAIAAVETDGAKALLVWKYSRSGRNRMGNQLNLARLQTAGGELVSATEEVDATTAVGKFTRGSRLAWRRLLRHPKAGAVRQSL
ncbi:recombinase family protein [Nonomuraea sp. B19D2]|uniref:recombinase family protein n=1 Tax=Nonomuraea sp. B19D2 TaxID=3159561 RepID=UPI0032DB9D16